MWLAVDDDPVVCRNFKEIMLILSKLKMIIGLGVIAAIGSIPISAGSQQNRPSQNLQEQNFQRADYFRERAQYNAQSQLGYPFIPYQTGRSDSVDYVALTHQIQVLAAQLQALAAEAARLEQAQNNAIPGLELPNGGQGAYGPEGPTENSVGVLLEYRLLVSGNPRLKAGSIRDEGENIRAQIVTEEGALVDEYLVNKQDGVWSPIR